MDDSGRIGALMVAWGVAFAVASPTAAQCAPNTDDGGGSNLVENVESRRDQVAATTSETEFRVMDGGVPLKVEGLMEVAESAELPRFSRFPMP